MICPANYGFESSFMAPNYLIFTPETRKESSEMAANGGQFCIFWSLWKANSANSRIQRSGNMGGSETTYPRPSSVRNAECCG